MSDTPDSTDPVQPVEPPSLAPSTKPLNAPAPEKPAGELQFDRAEVPVAKRCRMCNQPIVDSFYKLESKPICAACKEKVNAELTGGSSVERFLKASLFGTLAAAAGAGVYYGILAATGYELALISIGIGYVVGVCVRKGCGGRGGWVYQTLAVFLTYSAIATAYVPIVVGQFMHDRAAKTAAHPAATTTEANPTPTDKSKNESSEPVTNAPTPAPMNIVLALFLIAGVLFLMPIIVGFKSIVGLFIIGFGMYEAWKINKRVVVNITGPFSANTAVAPAGIPLRGANRTATNG